MLGAAELNGGLQDNGESHFHKVIPPDAHDADVWVDRWHAALFWCRQVHAALPRKRKGIQTPLHQLSRAVWLGVSIRHFSPQHPPLVNLIQIPNQRICRV